ncbi:MAG: class B sortase [Lachnospiraceae bacterium]|nr:class B sortase [Lachnospiraceae bacterium]
MESKGRNQFIRMVLLAIIIVCLIQIGRAYYLSLRHRAQQKELEEFSETADLAQTEEKDLQIEEESDIEGLKQEEEAPALLARYAALYEQNKDMVGWLAIEGTKIDYPVVRGMDNEYYLHHNFYGDEDKYGCLFVKDIADVDTPGANFVIYGHNMKDGAMFGELDFYQQKDFWKEHPFISFDTLYEERSYEIIAVFFSQVYEKEENIFKYYDFYEAETQEEFVTYYENIKKLSLYDTGVEASYGDTFLTLSTCAYHVDDGRFVVVAKRLD